MTPNAHHNTDGVFMKKKIVVFLLIICSALCAFGFSGNIATAESVKVFLGGMPAGFSMQTRGAFVAGLSDVITNDGIKSPAKDAGLTQGDIILYINDIEINNAVDIERVLKLSDKEIDVEYKRCDNTYNVLLVPAIDLSGEKKLGIFIKDDINGIGTVTFVDNKKIATLGHPVLDGNDGLLQIKSGTIFSCNITGYIKGERGKPGELRGVILRNEEIGTIDRNTEYGVFGTINDNFDTSNMTQIEIGEGKMGDAFIYTTISGKTPKKYTVSIVKADNLLADTKNYVVKITDKELLESTGGIVQGMSGSPIVQDGKLVGAITHVFINDPTRGFGISINNMLNK